MSPWKPTEDASPEDLTVGYRRSDQRQRQVLVGVDGNGVWVVYDVAGEGRTRRGLLVERLRGDQEKASQAAALAADYAACQTAFHEGRRADLPNANPLPQPTRIPTVLIARHTRAARHAVARSTPKSEPLIEQPAPPTSRADQAVAA